MPQFLKTLPVYINSLRKSEVLLPGLRSSVHQRLQLRSVTVSMDTRSTVAQLYPLVLPLVRFWEQNVPSWLIGTAILFSLSLSLKSLMESHDTVYVTHDLRDSH